MPHVEEISRLAANLQCLIDFMILIVVLSQISYIVRILLIRIDVDDCIVVSRLEIGGGKYEHLWNSILAMVVWVRFARGVWFYVMFVLLNVVFNLVNHSICQDLSV